MVVLFQVFCNYNLLRLDFVCDFQCAAIGLLLIEKGSTWFPEFTFDLFDPSSQREIFLSSLYIVYMCGYWDFTFLF